jgi:hypothetical protein
MYDRNYKGLVWTNHALSRMRERGISQGDAWATWRNPQQSRKGQGGSWVYYRTYSNQKIEVVAKQNEKHQWVILSVWSRRVPSDKKAESFFSFLIRKLFKS